MVENNNEKYDGSTPLVKQYFTIVDKYPRDTIVLMRVGDFYETYGEVAVITSKVLGITLTKRSIGTSEKSANLELSGFPYHSIDIYLPKLIHFGYKVAICDQLEDPSQAKGLVKRGVTEYVTPGLATQDSFLEKKRNNYLAAIFYDKKQDQYGVSFLDFSTGDFKTTQGTKDFIKKIIISHEVNEILLLKKQESDVDVVFQSKDKTKTMLPEWMFQKDVAVNILTSHFGSAHIRGLGLEDLDLATITSGVILQYLKDTGHDVLTHIVSIEKIDNDKYLLLDKFTIKNLELIDTQYSSGASLLDILDNTVTPMGGRLLRKWITLPLKNVEDIRYRQNFVVTFYKREDETAKIYNELDKISDMERLMSKISLRKAVVKDFIALKNSLVYLANIKSIFDVMYPENECVFYLCKDLVTKINTTLLDDPTQNNFVRLGVNAEFDELKKLKANIEMELENLLQNEIIRTGIASLKISYNKIFGYFFEVSNKYKNHIPSDWIRKQTLVNCERYVNEQLKLFEEKIENADERITSIENAIFDDLVKETCKYTKYILHNANIIAQLDCYINFAKIAKKYSYVCPLVDDGDILHITSGRHPVIERNLKLGEVFIPNDVFLDCITNQIMLITGPNMSGKSAFLRQVALITIMAQIGSFVPAESATIGVVDRIFTRVGASDNLSMGESTFMVEMTETASILRNITKKTLILMDEIGRGTSTYDGISIARSILEFLHQSSLKPKVLFATHYHELVDLEKHFSRLHNYSMDVKEYKDKILFLRKLENKSSEHSFGINVAKLAGIPEKIIVRAKDILNDFEQKDNKDNISDNNIKEKYYKIKSILSAIDVKDMNPNDALARLFEIQDMMGQDK